MYSHIGAWAQYPSIQFQLRHGWPVPFITHDRENTPGISQLSSHWAYPTSWIKSKAIPELPDAKAQKTCHGDDIQHPRGSLPPRSVFKKKTTHLKKKHLKDFYSCLKKFESFITFITSNYHPWKERTWQVCEQIPPFFTSEIPSTPNDSFDSSPVMYFTENSATAACGRFTL